jgi:hypothetical protein
MKIGGQETPNTTLPPSKIGHHLLFHLFDFAFLIH